METTDKIIIPRWFERHLHPRDTGLLEIVLPWTIRQRATGAVMMGNLGHPNETSTIPKTTAFRDRIKAVIPEESDFEPKMTCYLTDDTDPEEVVRGFEENVWCAVKLYLANKKGQGGTTGSQQGVRNLRGRRPVFAAMEREGIPVLGHFEATENDVDEFEREFVSFLRDFMWLRETFPDLPIVFEHITDGRVADFIAQAKRNTYGTVTIHGLELNRNAMFQGGMNPGYFCKPVPKSEEHRRRVREHVTSGNKNFGAGTDSAAHNELFKSKCYGCAAGIFTAPRAVEMYTTIFDEDNALKHLGPFLSENFLDIYGMKVSAEMMTIRRTPSQIPQKIGPVQVFRGGTELPWKLVA